MKRFLGYFFLIAVMGFVSTAYATEHALDYNARCSNEKGVNTPDIDHIAKLQEAHLLKTGDIIQIRVCIGGKFVDVANLKSFQWNPDVFEVVSTEGPLMKFKITDISKLYSDGEFTSPIPLKLALLADGVVITKGKTKMKASSTWACMVQVRFHNNWDKDVIISLNNERVEFIKNSISDNTAIKYSIHTRYGVLFKRLNNNPVTVRLQTQDENGSSVDSGEVPVPNCGDDLGTLTKSTKHSLRFGYQFNADEEIGQSHLFSVGYEFEYFRQSSSTLLYTASLDAGFGFTDNTLFYLKVNSLIQGVWNKGLLAIYLPGEYVDFVHSYPSNKGSFNRLLLFADICGVGLGHIWSNNRYVHAGPSLSHISLLSRIYDDGSYSENRSSSLAIKGRLNFRYDWPGAFGMSLDAFSSFSVDNKAVAHVHDLLAKLYYPTSSGLSQYGMKVGFRHMTFPENKLYQDTSLHVMAFGSLGF